MIPILLFFIKCILLILPLSFFNFIHPYGFKKIRHKRRKIHFFSKENQTYSGIHKDEIHLHEGKDHLQQGVDANQNVMTWRIEGYFEE